MNGMFISTWAMGDRWGQPSSHSAVLCSAACGETVQVSDGLLLLTVVFGRVRRCGRLKMKKKQKKKRSNEQLQQQQ